MLFIGLVDLPNTMRSLFEYPGGMSSADFQTPPGYEPQFAGFENLSYEEILELNAICGEDNYVNIYI